MTSRQVQNLSFQILTPAAIKIIPFFKIIEWLKPHWHINLMRYSIIKHDNKSPEIMRLCKTFPFDFFCLVDVPQEVKSVKGLMANSYWLSLQKIDKILMNAYASPDASFLWLASKNYEDASQKQPGQAQQGTKSPSTSASYTTLSGKRMRTWPTGWRINPTAPILTPILLPFLIKRPRKTELLSSAGLETRIWKVQI